jgi:hypothetical protein
MDVTRPLPTFENADDRYKRSVDAYLGWLAIELPQTLRSDLMARWLSLVELSNLDGKELGARQQTFQRCLREGRLATAVRCVISLAALVQRQGSLTSSTTGRTSVSTSTRDAFAQQDSTVPLTTPASSDRPPKRGATAAHAISIDSSDEETSKRVHYSDEGDYANWDEWNERLTREALEQAEREIPKTFEYRPLSRSGKR